MRRSSSHTSLAQPIAGFAALIAALLIAAGADASSRAPAAAGTLRGPSGCVSRTFTATDGRRVGTRTAEGGQRRFEIRANHRCEPTTAITRFPG